MSLIDKNIIGWLLNGDISIQYQTHRDLLGSNETLNKKLQKKIETEGWGARFLSGQKEDGHWGRGFYQPKWTSTHYTLMDLKNIGLPQDNPKTGKSIHMILDNNIGKDGGVNYSKTLTDSDVCITGMVVGFASYFKAPSGKLMSLIDYLLSVQMSDGGWNCEHIHGATHSSMHTTISVLEGFLAYKKAGCRYRTGEVEKADGRGIDFMLDHKLFQSHRTGRTMDKKMLMLSYPSRWRYDILRGLDYLRSRRVEYDQRMDAALEKLIKKRRTDKRWPLQMKHPGQVHFDMEVPGQPSRWNTLRDLRVLTYFKIDL